MLSPKSEPLSFYSRLFVVLLFCITALRFFLMQVSELFPDEALYYFLSVKQPLAFCPHPPGIPLLTGLGTLLLGKTEFGARLFSFLFVTLTIFPVYHLARKLGGKLAANLAVIAYASTPIFFMFGVISTPDGTQLFAYALALLLTWNALETGKLRWWLLAGLVVGTALYVKYIIILYFPALMICLLAMPRGRTYLRRPGPYLAAAVAFVIFVQFFVWREMETGWAAIRYHLSNRQRFEVPSLEDIWIYQLAHVGFYSPILYGLFLYAMVSLARAVVRDKDDKAAFLASFAIVPWAFFALIAAVTDRVLSREQWDAPAYIPALIGVALIISRWDGSRRERGIRWLKAGAAVGVFFIAVVSVEGATGVLSKAIGRKLLFRNLTGWNAMADTADRHLKDLPVNEAGKPIVLGDSFAPTLEYFFYSVDPAPVYSIFSRRNQKYGLSRVLLDSGASQVELSKHVGANAIYILEDDADRSKVKERENRLAEIGQMFESVEELPVLEIHKGGRPVRSFWYWRCLGLR